MARHIFNASDYPDLVLAWRVHATDDPHNEDTEIYAPCCGRKTIACSVADVRMVPGTVVSGGGWRPPKDHDWLCDGCRHRLFIEHADAWSESKLFKARGAPIQIVHWHRAVEWQEEMVRRVGGTPHNPQEMHELATEQIVTIHKRKTYATFTKPS
jgi:hypothetical protein